MKSLLKNGLRIKKPKNQAEAACFEELEKQGWTCTKRGWPDFFCIRDGEICAVEVKPAERIPLRREQDVVMKVLSEHRIPCYKWSPDNGMVKYEDVSRTHAR